MAAPITTTFSEETVKRALLCLAKNGGNGPRAHKELQAQGVDPCPSLRSIQGWKTQYADLYSELHDTHAREIEGVLIQDFRELAIAANQAALEAVRVATKKLPESRDPAGAARNLTVTAATAMDKLYLATDRPTSVPHDRNAGQILTSLAAKLGLTTPQHDADATAVEEPDHAPLLHEAAPVNAPAST